MHSIYYSHQIKKKHFIFSYRFSKKKSNMKCHEKPPSGSRVVGWGRADTTKINVSFRKIIYVYILCIVFRTEQRHIDALSKQIL